MQTASISESEFPLRRTVALASRRYTVNLTERQEQEIIAECNRRRMGISEFMRRIIDGWVETRLAKKEGGQ